MKNTLKYLFALAMTAAGTSTYAASGVIELEIPGMNEETAARIVDFRTNACPATVAALRDSIASNYDGVVLRKTDKRDELQAEADALAEADAELADFDAAEPEPDEVQPNSAKAPTKARAHTAAMIA